MSSLSELIHKASLSFNTSPALKIRDREISYAELSNNALSVSFCLKELGAKKETIAVVGQRKASSYIGLLGLIYSGNNYTPLNPKYNPSRL